MSSTEETELKGGHPPADKVGGMRVTRPHHSSGEAPAKATEKKKEGEEEEEVEPTPPVANPHTQSVLVDGALIKGDQAFTPEAVKQYHDKPAPTREPKHHNQPKQHNIQQPRN